MMSYEDFCSFLFKYRTIREVILAKEEGLYNIHSPSLKAKKRGKKGKGNGKSLIDKIYSIDRAYYEQSKMEEIIQDMKDKDRYFFITSGIFGAWLYGYDEKTIRQRYGSQPGCPGLIRKKDNFNDVIRSYFPKAYEIYQQPMTRKIYEDKLASHREEAAAAEKLKDENVLYQHLYRYHLDMIGYYKRRLSVFDSNLTVS